MKTTLASWCWKLVDIRAKQAALLGFADYASWSMADQMAKTPDAALHFMREIAPAARARAERELADIQQIIDSQPAPFAAQAWDWLYYAEQVRRGNTRLMKRKSNPISHSTVY